MGFYPLYCQLFIDYILEAYKTSISLIPDVGVSIINGDMTLQEGIQQADKALYRSKGIGRNKVSFYENMVSPYI